MRVFKFGGASVNSAEAVRNVASIMQRYGHEQIVVVISAMGKTTNAFEEVVFAAFYKRKDISEKIRTIKDFHCNIIQDLFNCSNHTVLQYVNDLFEEVEKMSLHPDAGYDEIYDRIVPSGELLSTHIVNSYLHEKSFSTAFLDARDVIKTDDRFRDASVQWDDTLNLVSQRVSGIFQDRRVRFIVTQGFIARTMDGRPTTLGREGSDFTASVFAHCLGATEVVVWKDVEGLLNADPVYFDDTVKIDKISYREAIELSFYGAKVLHPKTIKPLQNKKIPLKVKSFSNPDGKGSVVQESSLSDHLVPCFILKQNQMLISFASKDFSFIAEEKLYHLFGEFNRLNIKVNLMQNSAISFTICVNHPGEKLEPLLKNLSDGFDIKYNENLELLTIRHFNDEVIDKYLKGCKIFLEQRSRRTIQVAFKR
nr:aspartate kinase [Bacteroidota bacterium]